MARPVPTVPVMPPLDSALLEAHGVAHRSLHEAIQRSEPSVDRLFRAVQLRIVEESLAGIGAAVGSGIGGRRRGHSERTHARLLGARRVVAHVDARLEMWRIGHLPELVGADTPEVLNALAESSAPDHRDTDAGLIRATSSVLAGDATGYRPPDPGDCAELLRQAVDMVNRAPVPAVARAGWFAATLIALHPFVDGNGRVARAIFQLVASSEIDAALDWGVLEIWADERARYVDALMACREPAHDGYRGDLIDTAPFMAFGCDTSRRGAIRALARLRRVEAGWHGDWESASWDARLLEVATWAQGTATLGELGALIEEPNCTAIVNRLVADGRLRWGAFGLLSVADDHPVRFVS